jgi:hypothetical protein
MSWASHNPELYEEIVKQGIVNYLMRKAYSQDTYTEEDCLEFLDDLEDNPLHGIKRHIYDMLMSFANADIIDAEHNHFARQADRARDAAKDREMGL